mgnify:FL=1
MAQKSKELVGADDFKTDKTFICEQCLVTVFKGKPAVVAAYLTAPVLLTGCTIIDAERSYIFETLCPDCGEVFRITRRV